MWNSPYCSQEALNILNSAVCFDFGTNNYRAKNMIRNVLKNRGISKYLRVGPPAQTAQEISMISYNDTVFQP